MWKYLGETTVSVTISRVTEHGKIWLMQWIKPLQSQLRDSAGFEPASSLWINF